MANTTVDNVLTESKKCGRKVKQKIIYTTTEKKERFLMFLNWILQKLGKDKIDDITEFKDIKRSELDTIDILGLEDEWVNLLFPVYNKANMIYYEKEKKKRYILTLLRQGCKPLQTQLHMSLYKRTVNNFTVSDYSYNIVKHNY